jgi:uncharacterized protein YbjQ (UPF0145 family)
MRMDFRKVSPSAADDETGHDRTWTSGLSVSEFACLRTVGFEPVGQVIGASVHSLDARAMIRAQRRVASLGSLWGYSGHLVIYSARRAAMHQMEAECLALGGDGIVAVRVEIEPFHKEERTLAFRVYGTAVRARGDVRPRRPFSSDLSAQDFTKLIDAGWVPVELVLGMSLGVLTESGMARSQAQTAASPQEMWQWSPQVTLLRGRARAMLSDEAAAAGADGIVISDAGLKVYEFQGLRFVEAKFLGTAIAAFENARSSTPPSVGTNTIMRLSGDEPGLRW